MEYQLDESGKYHLTLRVTLYPRSSLAYNPACLCYPLEAEVKFGSRNLGFGLAIHRIRFLEFTFVFFLVVLLGSAGPFSILGVLFSSSSQIV